MHLKINRLHLNCSNNKKKMVKKIRAESILLKMENRS